MKKKLLQFGDTLGYNFIFPPYEENETWNSDFRVTSRNLVGKDGAWLERGQYGLKNPITFTKSFKLHSPELEYKWNLGCSCNCSCEDRCKLKAGWRVALTDYMYKGLYSGVQNAYFLFEDGTVRVTKAICESISIENSFDTVFPEVNCSFVIPDPYFYEVDERKTLWYDCIPFDLIVCGCANQGGYFPKSSLKGCCNLLSGCLQSGIILYDKDFYLKFPNLYENPSPTQITSPNFYLTECPSGSAGSGQICIKFIGDWTNPSITNLVNNTNLSWQGAMNTNDYFEICLSLYDECGRINADITDNEYVANFSAFNINDVVSSNTLFFLSANKQKLQLTGAGTNSYFLLTYLNKYH